MINIIAYWIGIVFISLLTIGQILFWHGEYIYYKIKKENDRIWEENFKKRNPKKYHRWKRRRERLYGGL